MIITQRILMAATGLFLILFLVVHLIGNSLLLLPPESAPKFYNMYAEVLSQNIFIKIVSIVLYISILGHALISLVLTIKSKQAKPRVYLLKENGTHLTIWEY